MFLLIVVYLSVFELAGVHLGMKVGDRKLHELDDDVFQCLLSLELVHQVLPASSPTVTHKLQQLYIVLKSPTCLVHLLTVLSHVHLLQDVHLHKPSHSFPIALVIALVTKISGIFIRN